MTHNEFNEVLRLAQVAHAFNFSHIWGSMYWTIQGESYRVADHAKPDASSGYVVGVNDFRSVDELYSKVSSILDLSDKTKTEEQYRKDAVTYVEQVTWHGELCYRNPLGGIYGTIDNAITNMWRCGYELI